MEAYLPGRGWTTFDPTPADPNPPSQSLWTTLGFYADAADTFWQEWVVSYDLGRQLALADKMEQSSSRFRLDWLNWTGQSAVALAITGGRVGAAILADVDPLAR